MKQETKVSTSKKKKTSLKTSVLLVTLIPIISMTVIIILFTTHRTNLSIENEEKEGMSNVACLFGNALDVLYPGDYGIIKSDKYVAVAKGEKLIDIIDEMERYKSDTGIESTIFYGNTRMITTLKDVNGVSMQGTTCNYIVERDVLNGGNDGFYSNVKIGNESYYAYYMPLENSDGKIVGMIAILKSSATIDTLTRQARIPIYVISTAVMLLAGCVSVMYSQRLIEHFKSIKKCLVAMENDDYSVEMNPKLRTRNDELGEMANAVVSMRSVIKKYTEMDGLTGIYNRRYGQKRLISLIDNAKVNGEKYSLCIADIDFFKNVNDTYGHDAGDIVLIKVAYELKKFIQGRGFVARWGGEEFLIVFEKLDLEKAVPLLEELRKKISELKFEFDADKQISMSFGIANGKDLSADDLVKLADNRLYAAKEKGRNQIICEDK